MKTNQIIKGNCIDVMKKIDSKSVELVLTDPPYNISGKSKLDLKNNTTGGPYYKMEETWDIFKDYKEYLDFTRSWIAEADRVLVEKGSIAICCSFHALGEILMALKEIDYKILNIITWRKTNPMPNITKRILTHSTEFIVWAAKSKGWKFNYEDMKKYSDGKQLRDVWEFPLCQGKERIKNDTGRAAHPNQKPMKLISRIVEMASEPGDLILDPFLGAGTTAVAANLLKRKWIGIENNPKYQEIAEKRIESEKKI